MEVQKEESQSSNLYMDGSKVVTPSVNFYSKYGKRMLDIFVGLVGTVVGLPLNLIIMVCTFFDVGQPIIFKQERIGLDCKPFWLFKFRNMTNETDENGKLLPASQRVTKFGKFVRKTSLDELLQFWLILTGKMSLIGPRPLPSVYLDQYTIRHRMRHAVRPGLECPPHDKDTAAFTWEDRFENDIWYVEHLSFQTDIHMIIRLFELLFNRKNNAVRTDVRISRGDYFRENRRKEQPAEASERING